MVTKQDAAKQSNDPVIGRGAARLMGFSKHKYYTSRDVTRIFGISRHKLIYWTEKAGLIEPYQRLPRSNLYDFRNLLDIGLVKTFVDFGISSTTIIEFVKRINESGDIWEWIKKKQEKDPANAIILIIQSLTPGEGAFGIRIKSENLEKKGFFRMPELETKIDWCDQSVKEKVQGSSRFIAMGNVIIRLDGLIAQIERLTGETLE